MTESFSIGNCAGFSGDRIDAPIAVVETLAAAGRRRPAAVFFEVLGERTIALAQLERSQDPQRGYEPMLERLLEPVLATCKRHGITILGNFGAANPAAAGRCIARLAERLGLPELNIAVIEGDDVRESLDLDGLPVYEADAGLAGAARGADELIAANAYLGHEPMLEALRQRADVVVAGRAADPALALAPLVHHYGWRGDDWDRLAAGTLAGHLLECGSQITGGVFYDPGCKDIPDPANIGFPIAEVAGDGAMTITKAAGTGGLVDLRTVKEQLLYEIHDPAAYLTPDVTLDITGVTLARDGENRVAVRGARGRTAPERLKVTACFRGGWLGEGEVSLAGPNCLARARRVADVLLERLRRRALPVRARVDLIGVASVHDDDGGTLWRAYDGPEPNDLRVRLAVEAPDRDSADQAAREVLALLCCGPGGTGGARWRTTPRLHTRSYLVPREAVQPTVTTRRAREFER